MNLNKLKVLVAAMIAVLLISVSVRASEIDKRIKYSINNSYTFNTYLKDDSITVQSKKGVVTLKGTIKEESHRLLAQETAANIYGVKKVNNQLIFTGDFPAENSDNFIEQKVKSALLFHREINASKTEVYVKDGVVTLKGEAHNQARKELSGEYACDVEGVKAVKNEMTLADNSKNTERTLDEKIDDASITAQVKMALSFHRSTRGISANISTNNGVVTMAGKANNEAEKKMAGKLADDIKGVKNVINNIHASDKPDRTFGQDTGEDNACGNEKDDANSCKIK